VLRVNNVLCFGALCRLDLRRDCNAPTHSAAIARIGTCLIVCPLFVKGASGSREVWVQIVSTPPPPPPPVLPPPPPAPAPAGTSHKTLAIVLSSVLGGLLLLGLLACFFFFVSSAGCTLICLAGFLEALSTGLGDFPRMQSNFGRGRQCPRQRPPELQTACVRLNWPCISLGFRV
jgi:hypothetical protein